LAHIPARLITIPIHKNGGGKGGRGGGRRREEKKGRGFLLM
jgi:hypothetical protein